MTVRSVGYVIANRMRARCRLEDLRSAGLCQTCARQPRVNETRCEACRQDHVEDQRLRRSAELPGALGVPFVDGWDE